MARKSKNRQNDLLTELKMPDITPKAKSNLPLIPLDNFLAISGKKFDQVAGFSRYAQNNKLGPLTVTDWQSAYNAFINKPIN